MCLKLGLMTLISLASFVKNCYETLHSRKKAQKYKMIKTGIFTSCEKVRLFNNLSLYWFIFTKTNVANRINQCPQLLQSSPVCFGHTDEVNPLLRRQWVTFVQTSTYGWRSSVNEYKLMMFIHNWSLLQRWCSSMMLLYLSQKLPVIYAWPWCNYERIPMGFGPLSHGIHCFD